MINDPGALLLRIHFTMGMNVEMKKWLFLAGIVIICSNIFAYRTDFNKDWKFRPESSEEWQKVTLPHDWSISLNFDRDAASGNDGGYLPSGKGEYKKEFILEKEDLQKKLKLNFEGVYMNSEILVNGQLAGGHPYGFSSFYVDITPFVKQGRNNVTVKVDNSRQKNCRWYTGSGIYRNVHLVKKDKVSISENGVRIVTPDLNEAVVDVKVANANDKNEEITVDVSLCGKNEERKINLNGGEEREIRFRINSDEVKPWSPDTPNLYECVVSVKKGGKVIDEEKVRVGFRTVEYSSSEGLKLNGEKILLNGGCVHHDNGILGAAAYDGAERKRAEQLKEAGFNAVRTSHNIPSESFLDACDEIGLLVIDESFDGWRDAKNEHDYHTLFDKYWQQDLDAMIMRDRNHPSIFCWSIGNEVIERDKIEVVKTAKSLAGRCRELDPTRPVTSALANWGKDWETYDPLAAEHDIVGYNYMIHESERDHERVPGRVMMQTESYPGEAWKNYRKCADHPYIIGDFVWTAMDYVGESGIGRWYYEGDVPGEHYDRPLYPWHAAYCGDIDLTGLRKPVSHYRSMLWNPEGEKLYMAVKEPDGYKGKIHTTLWGTWPTFECWNWPGWEGKEIEVEVYSRYPRTRLYLNDKLLGEKSTEEMKSVYKIAYQPGVLRAEGIADGEEKESFEIRTAGEPVGIRISADRKELKASGGEVSYLVIEAVDENGNFVPVSDNSIEVNVKGEGVLAGLGNADIKDEDPYYDNRHRLWNGRALAIVRSTGNPGDATVTVSSPNLKSARTKLKFVKK